MIQTNPNNQETITKQTSNSKHQTPMTKDLSILSGNREKTIHIIFSRLVSGK
jgi:hypothetical protein